MSLALATKGMICETFYVLEMGVDVDIEEIEVSVAVDDLSVDIDAEDPEVAVEVKDDSVGVVVEEPVVEVGL